MENESLELLSKSFFKRILTRWECRHFERHHDELLTVLAVSVYFDRVIFPKELEMAENIIKKEMKHPQDIECAIENMKFKLESYIKNEHAFLLDRERAFDIIADNIQLYGTMKDIFQSDGQMYDGEKMVEDVIKNEYDKQWKYSENAKGVQQRDEKWKN